MSKNLSQLSKKQIDSEELVELLEMRSRAEADFLLIDIREPYEYEAGHIVGVDMLLPTTKFQEWAPILAKNYTGQKLILTCRTANRTSQVQAILEQMGMKNIINHIGGIVEYQGAIEQGMDGARYV